MKAKKITESMTIFNCQTFLSGINAGVNTLIIYILYDIYAKETEIFTRNNCNAEKETPLKCKIKNGGMQFIGLSIIYNFFYILLFDCFKNVSAILLSLHRNEN
jgi:hypothetical protein